MVAMADVEKKAQSGASPSKEDSPSKPESSPADLKAEAYAVLGTGKRHLLVADIPSAVTSLGEACELLSAQFGETGVECAEAYFYYGKALLELARLESGVFGNALDGVPEGEDAENSQVEDPEKLTEEEKTDVEEKVDEALEENFENCEKKAVTNGVHANGEAADKSEGAEDAEMAEDDENKEEEESQEDEETEAEPEKGDTDSVGSTEEAKNEKEDEDKSAQDAEDEEDPSNLQLAWEMLELAKALYTKQTETTGTPEAKTDLEKKLCETYLVLGEVSLENENYGQAEDDLTNCLKMQQSSLSADSRNIAETHYQLGIAQGFHMKYEEAIESLNSAISVLETRITNLKNAPEAEKEESVKEVTELETLIPEIKEKIADTQEMKAENLKKMRESVGFPSSSGEGSSSSSGAKPIASIAIKRKNTEEEGDAKKAKE